MIDAANVASSGNSHFVGMGPRAFARAALLSALVLLVFAAPSLASGKVHWKPISGAILKLSKRPVKTWNLFQGDKKGRLFLVLLGKRTLILDLEHRAVFEPPPRAFPEISGSKEFEGRGPENSDRRIPASAWLERDIGPAELIRVTLGDYGQVLELQVPHPIDLRGLY